MNTNNLVLLGTDNIHYRIINQFIEKNLDLSVKAIKCEALITHFFPENTFFLIDVSSLSDAEATHWQNILSGLPSSTSTVLLNTDQSYLKSKILRWPNCCGVFSVDTELDELILGLKKIVNGEYWLPRAIMTDLLKHYRVDIKSPSDFTQITLTSREKDVLALLPTCKSNVEIADSLFVSEHTVKSHLYKVFKKIDVKNRLQAIAWVKENL